MSTGDQTQYVRSKIAERGSEHGAHFMTDGFDRWAESEAPARAGQVEKMPAETQMENYGGAMSLSRAKKLQAMMGVHGGRKLHGGVDLLATAKKAVGEAKKLIDMWRGLSQWIRDLKQELDDEIISNPKVPASYRNTAQNFVSFLNSMEQYQTALDGVAAAASLVGLGKHGGRKLHGGAFSLEDIGKYAAQIASLYGWLSKNKPGIQGILNLKSLNEGMLNDFGKKVWGVIEPFFKAIGLGRHGGRKVGGRGHCGCDDSSSDSEYHGGVLPILDLSAPTRKIGGTRGREPRMLMDFPAVGGKRHHTSNTETFPGMHGGRYNHVPGLRKCGPGDDPFLDNCNRGGRRHGGALTIEDRSYGPITAEEKMKLLSPEERAHYEAIQLKMASKPSKKVVGLGRHIGGRAPSARGEIVKKVMREQGLSLPQASKYVKEHGLY